MVNPQFTIIPSTQAIRFGHRLRELRRRKGLSLEALGGRAGLNAKFIQAIEGERQATTLHTIEKLTRGLDVPVHELFLFEDRDLARIVRLLEAALH